MFSFEKELFDGGDHKFRATTYEWPFEFVFPEHFMLNGNPFLSEPGPNHPWISSQGRHPLPPTINARGTYSTGCHVAYSIRAMVPRTIMDWTSKTYLNFQPVRLEFAPDARLVRRKQDEDSREQLYRFDDNFMPRALTTKESFKDKFSSHSETQRIRFVVFVTAPTVLVCGRPEPISVRIETPPTEMVIPDFEVFGIRAHLKAFNHIRVDGTFGDRTHLWEEKLALLDRNDLGFGLEINTEKPIQGVFGYAKQCSLSRGGGGGGFQEDARRVL